MRPGVDANLACPCCLEDARCGGGLDSDQHRRLAESGAAVMRGRRSCDRPDADLGEHDIRLRRVERRERVVDLQKSVE
jgi:hypothetical protein